MASLSNFELDFSPAVQTRGASYFRSGAVDLRKIEPGHLLANVRGERRYTCEIWWEGDPRDLELAVDYRCTCPYFMDQDEPCKHLWATLLQATAQCVLEPASDDDDVAHDGMDFLMKLGSQLLGGGMKLLPAPRERQASSPKKEPTKPPAWQRQLAAIRDAMQMRNPLLEPPPKPWPAERRILYVVDVPSTLYEPDALAIEVMSQSPKRGGQWEEPKLARLKRSRISMLPQEDRLLVQTLAGIGVDGMYDYEMSRFKLREADVEPMLRRMCATGRCVIRLSNLPDAQLKPLAWDDGPPWELTLEVTEPVGQPVGPKRNSELSAWLCRGNEKLPLSDCKLVLACGLCFVNQTIARFEHFGAFPLVAAMRHVAPITFDARSRDDLLGELLTLPRLPRLNLPPELGISEVRVSPRPRLELAAPDSNATNAKVRAKLSFDYDGFITSAGGAAAAHADAKTTSAYDRQRRSIILRDHAAESAAEQRLERIGFRREYGWNDSAPSLKLPTKLIPQAVAELSAEGWQVEAQGRLYRPAGAFSLSVESGIDWFDLSGAMDFGGGQSAKLPSLLAAVRARQRTVVLDDGSMGMLPEDWLKQYGLLANLGQAAGEAVRFGQRQVALLDALLASAPRVDVDECFARAREQLRRFEGVAPLDPPQSFQGELRPYQREGLGWLQFLERFGFGGCLADDMGLGKTVQVLALLEDRRRAGTEKPSLVVAPRSLVFNWLAEAARFAPQLTVLDHSHPSRAKSATEFANGNRPDVVLTTYGTLRADAAWIKDVEFDYAIVDEAQAIKNSSSASAKACRLIRADHRLALSGTPVQNHLGELWSLFEFLNPGMLGKSGVLKLRNVSREQDAASRAALARGLRPFILRRTKQQVARDLPERVEQTIHCELDKQQRKLYDELRDHYRAALLGRIESHGLNKSKMQVLEALLRLRQAACHPGLIDSKRRSETSAKLDALLPQLREVLDEGHKALVFSQFTSMLSIVRDRLVDEKIEYEYLDGQTRDRQRRVDRFQNDPECKLFLISLKAGGLGLNLTAADYAFLLDPWWNPAIEAQAIDRAHRIGQTRAVFAYRLIAKDTVEEKVLELQSRKRELADAIIGEDNSVLANLDRQTLSMLLS
jgi:superfamily II DNA or RNA helicase